MHFNDDFDKESPDEWSDVYSDKKHPSPVTARHRKKISNVEDAICQKWWKEYINFGMWVTFDESRVVGWYNRANTKANSDRCDNLLAPAEEEDGEDGVSTLQATNSMPTHTVECLTRVCA
jgi:hypothetical protein